MAEMRIFHPCPQKYAYLKDSRVGEEEAAPRIRKPQVDDAIASAGPLNRGDLPDSSLYMGRT